MSRERFIYYRVAATPALRDAALGMQRTLRQRHPQLQARLLCRGDGSEQTWLETYARPGGVDDALLAEIEALAAEVLAARLVGARHIETFEPCAS